LGHAFSIVHTGGIMSGGWTQANPTYPFAANTFTNSQFSAERSLDNP